MLLLEGGNKVIAMEVLLLVNCTTLYNARKPYLFYFPLLNVITVNSYLNTLQLSKIVITMFML